jgi:hypothetical protein
MAFQILSGEGWKTWSTAVFTIHQRSAKPELCLAFRSKLRETHRMAFANVVEGCLVYNFRIYHFCAQLKFLEKHTVKVGLTSWNAARSRSRAPPVRRAPCLLGPAPRAAPRRLCRPGPTASRHEPPISLCVGILGTRAASSCPVPRRTRPELPHSPSRVPPAERAHRGPCHTCFSKENHVQNYMHARVKFHVHSDI